MNYPFYIMKVPESSTDLCQNVPKDLFLYSVLLFRLAQDKVSQGHTIKQFHYDVDVLSMSKGRVVSGNVRVVQLFQDRDFLADFFNQQLIC